MATNFLEQLVAEWYEYQGYFIRRNVRVGRRAKGGHEGELDVVAFHPTERKLVHIEASMDADSWTERETRFCRKFETGERFIRDLFAGMDLPAEIQKRAIFGIGSTARVSRCGGAAITMLDDFLVEIVTGLKDVRWMSRAIPEGYPLLRTLQVAWTYRDKLLAVDHE